MYHELVSNLHLVHVTSTIDLRSVHITAQSSACQSFLTDMVVERVEACKGDNLNGKVTCTDDFGQISSRT